MRIGKYEILGTLSVSGDSELSGDLDQRDIARLDTNILLLGFYRAIDNSKIIYNLASGMVDEYEDQSGIDSGNSSSYSYNATDDYYTTSLETLMSTSPYAQFTLNEINGTTTIDTGSGANNGTASTDISNLTSTGKINTAYEFNGSSEYVNLDNLLADIQSDNIGSISLWFKANATDGILFSLGKTNSDYRLFVNIGDVSIYVFTVINGSTKWQTYTSLSLNTWTHLVISHNGTEPVIYKNGINVTNFSTSTDKTIWINDFSGNLDNARLGCGNWANNGNVGFYNGILDDVRYYKTALTATEIAILYNAGTGTELSKPYCHYKCNDNAGNTTVTDNGLGAHNGTASTNTSNLSETGKINNCFHFLSASTRKIDITTLATAIKDDKIGAISFWINIDSTDDYHFWSFSKASTPEYRLNMSIDTVDMYVDCYVNNLAKWRIKVALPSVGVWTHYVVVHNGVSPVLYKNGVDITSFYNSNDLTAWMSALGANIDTGRIGNIKFFNLGEIAYTNGKIDDWRYYRTPLSQSDVQKIYNYGHGTENAEPLTTVAGLTLQSIANTAESAPSEARIVLFEEDVDDVTLNTDLKAYISRDNGTTWSQATLTNEGNYDSNKQILTGEADVSGQPSGTNIKYKITTHNNKYLTLHGVGINWD